MPIERHALQNGKGGLWICRGILTGKELIANNEDLLSAKRYEGVRWLLIDETDATLDISAEEIRVIRRQDDIFATLVPEFVTAVAVSSAVGFGMSRMWEMMTERPGWSVRSFRSRYEAEAWLRDEVERKFGTDFARELESALASCLNK